MYECFFKSEPKIKIKGKSTVQASLQCMAPMKLCPNVTEGEFPVSFKVNNIIMI